MAQEGSAGSGGGSGSGGATAGVKRKLNRLRPSLRKKLKAERAATEGELTPEEKKRRAEQRRRRDLAMRLRAEGRSYDARTFKAKKDGGSGAGKAKAKVKIKSGQRNRAPYQVVILPIAWHQREEESARIVASAEAARRMLEAAGYTCRIDDGDKLTPGQKMKYWELRGVRVRLEIGPKESLAGTAVLAVAQATPGQVATKSSVRVREPVLCDRVRSALLSVGALLAGEDGGGGGSSAGGDVAGGGSGNIATAEGSSNPDMPPQQQQQGQHDLPGDKKKKKKREADTVLLKANGSGGDVGEGKTKKKKKMTHEQQQEAAAAAKADKAVLKAKLAMLTGGDSDAEDEKAVKPAADRVRAANKIAERSKQGEAAGPQPELQQSKAQRQPKPQRQQEEAAEGPSADALEDDFGIDVLVSEDVRRGKSGKHPKKDRAGGSAGSGLARRSDASTGGETKKKPKVVKF